MSAKIIHPVQKRFLRTKDRPCMKSDPYVQVGRQGVLFPLCFCHKIPQLKRTLSRSDRIIKYKVYRITPCIYEVRLESALLYYLLKTLHIAVYVKGYLLLFERTKTDKVCKKHDLQHSIHVFKTPRSHRFIGTGTCGSIFLKRDPRTIDLGDINDVDGQVFAFPCLYEVRRTTRCSLTAWFQHRNKHRVRFEHAAPQQRLAHDDMICIVEKKIIAEIFSLGCLYTLRAAADYFLCSLFPALTCEIHADLEEVIDLKGQHNVGFGLPLLHEFEKEYIGAACC